MACKTPQRAVVPAKARSRIGAVTAQLAIKQTSDDGTPPGNIPADTTSIDVSA